MNAKTSTNNFCQAGLKAERLHKSLMIIDNVFGALQESSNGFMHRPTEHMQRLRLSMWRQIFQHVGFHGVCAEGLLRCVALES